MYAYVFLKLFKSLWQLVDFLCVTVCLCVSSDHVLYGAVAVLYYLTLLSSAVCVIASVLNA